jgi:hypothetical protein
MKNLIRLILGLSLCATAHATSTYVAGFPQGTTTSGLPQNLSGGAVTTSSPSYTNGQIDPFTMTTAGALRVDGSAVTQPVSGTFWQATQPVSIASMPSTPVTGTFWQTTQPVSFTMPSLVAGSANIGHVDGEGTAGSPSGGVVSIQGVSGGTAVPVSGSLSLSGSTSNASDAVATGSTNVPTVADLFAYNGSTFDRLRDDSLFNLKTISPDQVITGQGSQTTLNNNVILATAGSSGQACAGYHSWSIEIVPASGTVTAGVVTFQGSNDNVNFQAIYMYDQNAPGSAPVTNYTITATTNRFFKGPLQWQYVKAILSTGITGTTTGVQAFTTLSTEHFTADVVTVNLGYGNGTTNSTATTSGTVYVQGTANTGQTTSASGYPFVGAGSVLSTLPSAAISTGKTEYLPLTGDQQVIVHQDGDPSNEWQATSGSTPLATTTSTAIKAAGASGVRNYCTGLQLVNTSTSVATAVYIEDGSTIIWSGFLPEATATSQTQVNVEFRTPLKGTAATAMNIVLGTTGASVYYDVQGYQNN